MYKNSVGARGAAAGSRASLGQSGAKRGERGRPPRQTCSMKLEILCLDEEDALRFFCSRFDGRRVPSIPGSGPDWGGRMLLSVPGRRISKPEFTLRSMWELRWGWKDGGGWLTSGRGAVSPTCAASKGAMYGWAASDRDMSGSYICSKGGARLFMLARGMYEIGVEGSVEVVTLCEGVENGSSTGELGGEGDGRRGMK